MNNTVQALKGKVLVDKIESGERRTRNGIIILDDNGKPQGIRERWAQIYAVGPDVGAVVCHLILTLAL
jgi:co-chaperonin GroES (HSP10)